MENTSRMNFIKGAHNLKDEYIFRLFVKSFKEERHEEFGQVLVPL